MTKSFVDIMRIEEMIYYCKTNSPCQYLRKHIKKRMENIDTDVAALRVNRIAWID